MRKLILASGSPSRKEMFEKAGLVFEVCPSSYEEDMSLQLSPRELAKHLSMGKAEAVARNYKQGVIVGADTFVVFQNQILGKPHTPERAKEMLRMLNGNQHSVITGFTIIDVEYNKIVSTAIETKVVFKNLSDKEIDDYVATGEPLKCAGSYGVLKSAGKFIKEIVGSKSNIAGLPMEEVMEVLKEFNIINQEN